MSHPNPLYDPNETCDCETCKDSEKPCHFDCDLDSLCTGCEISKEEREEIMFQIDWELGRR